MNKVKLGIVAVLSALVLTGCYAKGEILEVEVEQGEHGEVKELEVAREEGPNPDRFEADVPADSPCDVGDIYPACKK